MIGQTISHYRVLSKLGEGGMGVVYKAEDTRLDRMIALKFLPSHTSPDARQRERFVQEAKAAAALNHPNICVIYGIGEHEGSQFIEMEYVEGMTLRDRLASGTVSVADALGYAVQVAGALEEAHAHGIVHRDVKPENIIVTAKNQVKVMDFGLAKLKGTLRLTRTQAAVGTLNYMAPEQLHGEDVDARTDVFALGVVMYEMLTGRSPFRGAHEAAVMYSIVHEDPKPLRELVKEVPPALEQVVLRALRKDPGERYQTARDLATDLQKAGSGASDLLPAPVGGGRASGSSQQRRLSAIMFTDIVGYSALTQKNEALALEILEHHNTVLRSVFPSYEGREIKTVGDAFLIQFESSLDAVRCAKHIQEKLREENTALQEERRFQVRIGIHVGDVIHRDGDVFGDGVNIAARLCPVASPGGVCLSEDTARQVINKIDVPVRRIRDQRLKNISQSVSLYEVVFPWSPSVSTFLPSLRRSHVAWAGVVAAGVLAVAAYMLLSPPAGAADRVPVAVADFVNQTNEPELDGLSGMLITSLEQSNRLAVVTRARMFDILRQTGETPTNEIDEPLARKICRQAGVRNLVTASIRKFGKIYTIDLKILDPEGEEYLLAVNEQGEGQESIPSMLDRLSEKTRLGLREAKASVAAASTKVTDMTTTNFEAYQAYFRGEYNLNLGQFEYAIVDFERAIRIDSTFALAYYKMAYMHDARGRPDFAKPITAKALSMADRLPAKELQMARALELRTAGKVPEAVALLRSIENRYPAEKDLLWNIGDWLYHGGRPAEALPYLEKVVEIDPSSVLGLSHIVWIHRDQADYLRMEAAAKQYVTSSGGHNAYQLLGQAYTLQGKFDEGVASMRQALGLFPDNAHIAASMCHMLLLQGKYAEAESEGLKMEAKARVRRPDKLTHDDPEEMAFDVLIAAYYYTGRYNKAFAYLDKGIKRGYAYNDTTVAMFHQIERALVRHIVLMDDQGAWKEAQQTMRFSTARGRMLTPWRQGLILLAAYRGDTALVNRFTGTTHIGRWSSLLDLLIATKLGNPARAAAMADTSAAIHFHTMKPFSLYPLAVAHYLSGNDSAAVRILQELTDLQHDMYHQRAFYYPLAILMKGKAYERMGNLEKADQAYAELLNIWSNADRDLPPLKEAKSRRAALRSRKLEKS